MKKYISSAVLIVFLLLYVLLEAGAWLRTNIPKELREGSSLLVAQAFAKGENPYVVDTLASGSQLYFHMYGFLFPLLIGLLSRFSGASVLSVAALFYALCKLSALALFARIIWDKYHSLWLSLLSAALLYTCFWRYTVYGGAFPDVLGLLLCLILYDLMERGIQKNKLKTAVMAFLAVLLFYTKMYFAFTAAGIFVYLLIFSRKDCIRFSLSGMAMGILSLVLVNRLFPLYFTYSMLYMSGSPGYHTLYALKQLVALGKYFPLPILTMMFCFFRSMVYLLQKRAKASEIFTFPLVQLLCMLPVALFFGRNDGTWLTYFLQLLMPAALLYFAEQIRSCEEKRKTHSLADVILSLLLILPTLPYCVNFASGDQELKEWKALYAAIDEKRADAGEEAVLLLSYDLSFYCLQKDLKTIDYGQCEYISKKVVERWEDSPLLLRLMPYAGQVYDKFHADTARVAKKLYDTKTEYIFVDTESYRYDMDEDLIEESYLIEKSYPVKIGSFAREIRLYKRMDG